MRTSLHPITILSQVFIDLVLLLHFPIELLLERINLALYLVEGVVTRQQKGVIADHIALLIAGHLALLITDHIALLFPRRLGAVPSEYVFDEIFFLIRILDILLGGQELCVGGTTQVLITGIDLLFEEECAADVYDFWVREWYLGKPWPFRP